MNKFSFKIEQDPDADDPRSWGHASKMVCWHRRYKLGDKQPDEDPFEYLELMACNLDPKLEDRLDKHRKGNWTFTKDQRKESDEIAKAWIDRVLDKHFIRLPLYLYDHSGITMKTTPFGCRWDSGQVGFIYISRKDACKEYGWKVMTKKREDLTCLYLEGEVEDYDKFISGEVYVVTVVEHDEDGDIVDSNVDCCGGYFGREAAEEAGREMVEQAIKNDEIVMARRIFPVASLGV